MSPVTIIARCPVLAPLGSADHRAGCDRASTLLSCVGGVGVAARRSAATRELRFANVYNVSSPRCPICIPDIFRIHGPQVHLPRSRSRPQSWDPPRSRMLRALRTAHLRVLCGSFEIPAPKKRSHSRPSSERSRTTSSK